jgi:hypothetical protein
MVMLVSCDGKDDGKIDPLIDSQVRAREQMEKALRDPDSAKYSSVQAFDMQGSGPKEYIFCGEVNAKNGFGGYAGNARFVAGPGLATMEPSESGDDATAFELIWKTMCSPAHYVRDVEF